MPPIAAFTGQQVERLTGLSRRVLRYWEQTGVFTASYVDERPHVPYRRIYSFRDVVGLRTLALLRRRVPLDELRKTGQFLQAHYAAPWAELMFGVVGKRVVFRDSETGSWLTGAPLQQKVIPFSVDAVAREVEREAALLRRRQPDDIGRVVRHRHVLRNAWRLAGTRIPTSAVWNLHEAGFDLNAIIKAYPDLEARDVAAALAQEQSLRSSVAA